MTADPKGGERVEEVVAKAAMTAARAAVRASLPQAARELLTWRDTALLPNGVVRQIARPLLAFAQHDAVRIVEGLVRDAALEAVATPPAVIPQRDGREVEG